MKGNPEERTDIYFKRHKTFEHQDAILDGRVRHYNGRIVQWNGSERNKALIREFQQHLFAKGTNQYRVGKLTMNLRLITELIDKDFDTLTKKDAEAFLAKVNKRDRWSLHTKRDYTRNFKQFFLWLEEEDPRLQNGDDLGRHNALQFYRYVRKITTAHPRQVLDYANILTDEDLQKMLKKGCRSSLERAMVALLHETGVRVGELLGMRIRDVERKERHALIRVNGKTGERRIPIIQCIPWLELWLQDHPARENRNALLWVSTHNGHRGEPFRHMGVRKLLMRTMERSEIGKQCNPHWFRHSRATILAPRYQEQVLCRLMGWELGSKQVRTYVHLGAKQVEDAFLRDQGLEKPEERQQKVQFCVCGATNPPDGRYCLKCGLALSVGTMVEDEGKKAAAIDEAIVLLERIMADPTLRAKFEKFQPSKQALSDK